MKMKTKAKAKAKRGTPPRVIPFYLMIGDPDLPLIEINLTIPIVLVDTIVEKLEQLANLRAAAYPPAPSTKL